MSSRVSRNIDAESNPTAFVDQLLSAATTQKERAQVIFDTLIRASEAGQKCNEVVAIIHSKAEEEKTWTHLGLGKAEFNEHIHYDDIVAPAVEAFRKTDARRKRCVKDVEDVWGDAWRSAADPEDSLIPHDSERTLGAIRRISRKIPAKVFGAMLAQAIDDRLKNWSSGKRTQAKGTLSDLKHVEKKLTVAIPTLTLPEKRLIEAAPHDSNPDTDAGSHVDSDAPTEKRQRLRSPEDAEDAEDANDESEKAVKTGVSFRDCVCKNKKENRNKLAHMKKQGLADVKTLIKNIEFLKTAKVAELCWNHLRDFCTVVGLRTQIGGRKTLVARLEVLWQKRYELGTIKTDPEYRAWFVQALRGKDSDGLGTLRFVPKKQPKFAYNPEEIFLRYAGADAAKVWKKDGTVIVPGVMKWLFEDPEVIELMHHEVHMYYHHRTMMEGRKSLGWLRSAFFSQIQQIARQDPVYYALVAATSGEPWQISFPYYMKATLPGDGIFFHHLDLNLTRYIECGRGARRIQTSCTLNQETETNCTMVVPGFHNKLASWWQDVLDQDNTVRDVAKHSGNCLKTHDIFTAADKKKYGDFVPAVCGPGDIRISRPEIIHGSTANKDGKADSHRLVVNPWFLGIQEDHETLDIPECGTWTLVVQAHRDLIAPKTTPSGQINTHGRTLGRFPASLPLRHISHLSDALVGQTRWDDPLVQMEMGIVLGGDSAHAWEFIDLCRRRAIRKYKYNADIIKSLEKATYGRNSYFRLVENGLYREPRYEGDYSGEAPYSDTDDVEDTEDLEDNVRSTNSGVDSDGEVLKGLFLE